MAPYTPPVETSEVAGSWLLMWLVLALLAGTMLCMRLERDSEGEGAADLYLEQPDPDTEMREAERRAIQEDDERLAAGIRASLMPINEEAGCSTDPADAASKKEK